ncbi:MAG: DUF2167 domain-containing protein [Hyphomonadaceae bacterium]|nr:DUF2167 domain-containing protein [Hyphomonadaceae bacterium]
MRKNLMRAALAALALVVVAPAYADGPGNPGPNEAAPPVRAAPTTQPPASQTAPPQGQTGVVPLGDSGLSLNVPANYRFYSAAEARAFAQRANQQAPSGEIYGLLARNGDDIRAPGTWATIVSYDPIGYVQPQTASGLTDANFETQVRDARQTQNRHFEGFATAPSFNAEAPYVVWAERVAAPGGAGGKDLRYEQKIMGREGVAGMTSIGSADQQPAIASAAATLRGMLSFPEGKRHADFDPAADTVSDYSVPGLVTGVPTPSAQSLANVADNNSSGQTAFGGLSGYFPWIALGVVILAGGGYLLMRRRDDDEEFDEA